MFDYLLALPVRLGKRLVLFPDRGEDGVEVLVAQRELFLKLSDVLRIGEDEGYHGLLGIRVSRVLLRFGRRGVAGEDQSSARGCHQEQQSYTEAFVAPSLEESQKAPYRTPKKGLTEPPSRSRRSERAQEPAITYRECYAFLSR